MDIWIPVLAALVTGLISFIASTMKSSKELDKVKIENESKLEQLKQQHLDEMDKLEKEHLAAIKKMETEVELKLKEYGDTKETDVKYGFLNDIIRQALTNPQQAAQSMEGLQKLSDLAKQMSNDNEKK
ncbi:hypothetical protein LJC61_00680 [Ruminococcaceae bacterium OttesenSCG-928-A16]|nr:hypothetical protein [Ruminococcaceae bacterium OttesenSCG-928-A16]